MHRTHFVRLLLAFATPWVVTSAVRADDNVVQQQSEPAARPAPPAPAQTAPANQQQPVVQQTTVDADDDEDRPSIFTHGYQGLLAGAAVGAGAGYLFARREGWERSDWRAVGLGIGIGSLAGAGLGLTLGVADRGESQGSRYVARDMLAGTAFGAVIGTVSGGIAAGMNNEPENVLAGASIGVIAGAGLGVLIGIIEGQAQESEQTTVTTGGLRLRPDLAVARSVYGATVVAPGIAGTF